MKYFIYLSLFFLTTGFCKAQNGFYGKRLSVAGAVLLNKPGSFLNKKPKYPTYNLGLRYTLGGRGQFAVDYTAGSIEFVRFVNFRDPNRPGFKNELSNVDFPIQKTSSIFIEQRLFRKNSYAPIGSYVGIGIGINNYKVDSGIIDIENNGINYKIPIERPIQTNYFINDYYITMGKVIPLGKRLLLDIHLRFNGIFLFNFGDRLVTQFGPIVELNYNESEGTYTVPDFQYYRLEETLRFEAERYQRNIPRLLFSVQYLIY